MGFPSRLLDSSFKIHTKLTTFILGQNHITHQSDTLLHTALRIDCVFFGTYMKWHHPKKVKYSSSVFYHWVALYYRFLL